MGVGDGQTVAVGVGSGIGVAVGLGVETGCGIEGLGVGWLGVQPTRMVRHVSASMTRIIGGADLHSEP
jgi:hypothetical protein